MRESKAPAVFVVFLGMLTIAAAVLAKASGQPIQPWIQKALWLGVPISGVLVVAPKRPLWALGLTRFDGTGVAVAAVGSLAMLAGLAITADGSPVFDVYALWDGALRPAFTEELMFRGFAFGVLFWHVGWSFRSAMLVTGIVFGSLHLPGAIVGGHLDQAWGTALITTAGGCWFAWLYARWNRSLWVPIATHFFMNAWWVIYTAGPTAGGGGAGATWGRVAAIVAISVATAKLTIPSTPQTSATE
jgi:uncharacterized protein